MKGDIAGHIDPTQRYTHGHDDTADKKSKIPICYTMNFYGVWRWRTEWWSKRKEPQDSYWSVEHDIPEECSHCIAFREHWRSYYVCQIWQLRDTGMTKVGNGRTSKAVCRILNWGHKYGEKCRRSPTNSAVYLDTVASTERNEIVRYTSGVHANLA